MYKHTNLAIQLGRNLAQTSRHFRGNDIIPGYALATQPFKSFKVVFFQSVDISCYYSYDKLLVQVMVLSGLAHHQLGDNQVDTGYCKRLEGTAGNISLSILNH